MAESNPNARLEAFCDGVFAIALTLLVIDLRLDAPDRIGSTTDFWRALQHLAPSFCSFLLSFVNVFITWVNHHAALKLMKRSSAAFIYANGLLLLMVVFIPFPTSLLGNFLLTDHAAPAVVLYDSVLAVQALGWIAIGTTALHGGLVADEAAALEVHVNLRHGFQALAFYSLLAVLAFWVPFATAVVTTVSWIFWLVLGVRMRHAMGA
jgi:uncharacterized membrane protein